MATFPKLKTGAATQYPATASLEGSTQVTRFVDGRQQRFLKRAELVRRWELELSLLDEAEIRMLESFFAGQKGAAGTFEFEDPHSGVVYANCRFEHDQVEFEASELFQNKGRLRIRTV
jgi:hypothetical protein